jgi:hypothetical protein
VEAAAGLLAASASHPTTQRLRSQGAEGNLMATGAPLPHSGSGGGGNTKANRRRDSQGPTRHQDDPGPEVYDDKRCTWASGGEERSHFGLPPDPLARGSH